MILRAKFIAKKGWMRDATARDLESYSQALVNNFGANVNNFIKKAEKIV